MTKKIAQTLIFNVSFRKFKRILVSPFLVFLYCENRYLEFLNRKKKFIQRKNVTTKKNYNFVPVHKQNLHLYSLHQILQNFLLHHQPNELSSQAVFYEVLVHAEGPFQPSVSKSTYTLNEKELKLMEINVFNRKKSSQRKHMRIMWHVSGLFAVALSVSNKDSDFFILLQKRDFSREFAENCFFSNFIALILA